MKLFVYFLFRIWIIHRGPRKVKYAGLFSIYLLKCMETLRTLFFSVDSMCSTRGFQFDTSNRRGHVTLSKNKDLKMSV